MYYNNLYTTRAEYNQMDSMLKYAFHGPYNRKKRNFLRAEKLSIRNIVSVGDGYGDGNDDNGDADVDRKLAEIIRPSTNDSKCFCYYYCSFKQLNVHCKKLRNQIVGKLLNLI